MNTTLMISIRNTFEMVEFNHNRIEDILNDLYIALSDSPYRLFYNPVERLIAIVDNASLDRMIEDCTIYNWSYIVLK